MLRCKMTLSRWSSLLGGVCLLALTAGCSQNPEAEFAWRDTTLDLLPKAREGVQGAVNQAFGTPHDLVAWDKFPVEFGGVRGSVAAPPEGTTPAPTKLWIVTDGKIEPGTELFWITGKTAAAAVQAQQALQAAKQVKEGESPSAKQISDAEKAVAAAEKAQVVKVTAVSSDGKELTLSKPVDTAEGDTFAINFGAQLQLGRAVYMKNCNHCHGVAGDGNGPTAQYLNPRPRDYRLGLFKFTSTLSSEKVSREDLKRIILNGIPGTYMPSFLLLGNNDGGKEMAAVVEYVRWLAMRGEMEKRLVDELTGDYSQASIDEAAEKSRSAYEDAKRDYDKARKAGDKDAAKPEPAQSRTQLTKAANEELKTYLDEEFSGTINDTAEFIADAWKRADDPASLVVPTEGRVTDDAASRERGRLLYMSDKAKCYTCHGAKGRGNGPAVEDFWKKPGSNETYDKRGLHDTWGNPLPPRDLTRGQYRGGRRPIDVFARVYSGIKGTPMPAFGGTVLKDSDIWDIVNFVMSLPYEESGPVTKPAAAPHMAATETVGQ